MKFFNREKYINLKSPIIIGLFKLSVDFLLYYWSCSFCHIKAKSKSKYAPFFSWGAVQIYWNVEIT